MARPKAIDLIPDDVLLAAYDAVELGESAKSVWERLLVGFEIAYRTWLQYVERHRQARKAQIIKDRMVICGELAATIAGDEELTGDQRIALGSIVMAALSEKASFTDNMNLRMIVRDLAKLRSERATEQREQEAHRAEMERKRLLLESLQATVQKGDSETYGGEEGREKLKQLVREVYGIDV